MPGVLGALCHVPRGGDTLSTLPVHAALPSQVIALEISFGGIKIDREGSCVRGWATRTGHNFWIRV